MVGHQSERDKGQCRPSPCQDYKLAVSFRGCLSRRPRLFAGAATLVGYRKGLPSHQRPTGAAIQRRLAQSRSVASPRRRRIIPLRVSLRRQRGRIGRIFRGEPARYPIATGPGNAIIPRQTPPMGGRGANLGRPSTKKISGVAPALPKKARAARAFYGGRTKPGSRGGFLPSRVVASTMSQADVGLAGVTAVPSGTARWRPRPPTRRRPERRFSIHRPRSAFPIHANVTAAVAMRSASLTSLMVAMMVVGEGNVSCSCLSFRTAAATRKRDGLSDAISNDRALTSPASRASEPNEAHIMRTCLTISLRNASRHRCAS